MTGREAVVRRVAAIDLGTVSSRLSLAEVRGGDVLCARKHTEITDLGQGVDATGRFDKEAVRRVVDACTAFVREARAFGATHTLCTLTSAARDAENADMLLGPLRELGLVPQIIPGETEARLTFFGVAHDFPAERIAVADSGGGSTEIAVGAWKPGSPLELERVQSLNIGCRRVTDRFLAGDPPAGGSILAAGRWVREQFTAYWEAVPVRPDRLVAVGGTATTLVAMTHELEPYDPAFVHLRALTATEIERQIDSMRKLAVDRIAQLPGIQAKRAPVMLAGAVILRELLRTGGYDKLTVSENSLLAGAASTMGEVLAGERPSVGWNPELAEL